jgi:hypothetical protein
MHTRNVEERLDTFGVLERLEGFSIDSFYEARPTVFPALLRRLCSILEAHAFEDNV